MNGKTATEKVLDTLRLCDDYLGQVRRVQRAARYYLQSPNGQTQGDLEYELSTLRNMNG